VIRTVIVDDAALARRGVRLRLAGEPDVEIVGEAADGAEAVAVIQTMLPDLVFLDVQMPRGDGFDVLEHIGGTKLPAVIFITAYDRYAIRAFEARAVDYLLKPVSDARFQEALNRVRSILKNEE
jgi:two-component system, LytTR family, response regulator